MTPILTTRLADGRTIPQLICPTCGQIAVGTLQDQWQKNLKYHVCPQGHEFNHTAKRVRKKKHGKS